MRDWEAVSLRRRATVYKDSFYSPVHLIYINQMEILNLAFFELYFLYYIYSFIFVKN